MAVRSCESDTFVCPFCKQEFPLAADGVEKELFDLREHFSACFEKRHWTAEKQEIELLA